MDQNQLNSIDDNNNSKKQEVLTDFTRPPSPPFKLNIVGNLLLSSRTKCDLVLLGSNVYLLMSDPNSDNSMAVAAAKSRASCIINDSPREG